MINFSSIGPPGLIGPVGLKGNYGPVGAPGIDGFSGRDGEKGDHGFPGKLERNIIITCELDYSLILLEKCNNFFFFSNN